VKLLLVSVQCVEILIGGHEEDLFAIEFNLRKLLGISINDRHIYSLQRGRDLDI